MSCACMCMCMHTCTVMYTGLHLQSVLHVHFYLELASCNKLHIYMYLTIDISRTPLSDLYHCEYHVNLHVFVFVWTSYLFLCELYLLTEIRCWELKQQNISQHTTIALLESCTQNRQNMLTCIRLNFYKNTQTGGEYRSENKFLVFLLCI